MIFEIQAVDDEEMEAVLLAMPAAAARHGFRLGDIKVRTIRRRGRGLHEFRCETLCRNSLGGSDYESQLLKMPSTDSLYLRNLALDNKLGSEQRWRRLSPGSPEMAAAWSGRAAILIREKRLTEAAQLLEKAAKSQTTDSDLLNDIAWTLATSAHQRLRNSAASIVAAERANQLTGFRNAAFLDTLAAAHASHGRFGEAIRFQNQALQELEAVSKEADGPTALYLQLIHGPSRVESAVESYLKDFHERLEQFQQELPYRQPG
jgi:tetratricopeptide (TPR) repeat protein